MGFPLGWLSSHESVGQAVLWPPFPVTGLVIAFKLTRAPAIVKGAVAAPLLTKFHVIIDHLIWICMEEYMPIITITLCCTQIKLS